jgi:hypothetical protein
MKGWPHAGDLPLERETMPVATGHPLTFGIAADPLRTVLVDIPSCRDREAIWEGAGFNA